MTAREPAARIVSTRLAWAISTGSPKNTGFIGRYWTPLAAPEDPLLAGYRTATFDTRREARAFLVGAVKRPGCYHAFPRARVVRVRITIEEVGHG
jgi:hypothetical protein